MNSQNSQKDQVGSDCVTAESLAAAGERAVLVALLRRCASVIGTIEAENCDEADMLVDLGMQIAKAISPQKGPLL